MSRGHRLRPLPTLVGLAVTGLLCAPGVPVAGSGGAVAVGETSGRVAAVHTVRVLNQPPYYAPEEIRIRVGDSVRWLSGPLSERHGMRDVGRGAFSLELPPGGEVTVRFDTPGEHPYRCRFHPWMSGRIIVEEEPLRPRTVELASAELHGARLVAGGGNVFAVGAGSRPWVVRLRDGEPGPRILVTRPAESGGPAAAGEGALWLLAADRRSVLHWRAGMAGTEHHPLPPARGPITALAAAPDGSLWAYDAGGGRLLRQSGGGEVEPREVDATGRVTALRIDADGRPWLVDETGLGVVDGPGPLVRRPRAAPAPGARLAVTDGGAWFVEDGGARLLRWSPGGPLIGFPVPPAVRPPRALAALSADDVWLVGHGVGHLEAGELRRRTLAGWVTVTDLAFDVSGDLWLLDGDHGRLGHLRRRQVDTAFRGLQP